LLIQSGAQPISAQNAHPPLSLGGPPLIAAAAITAADLAAVRDAIGFASRGRPKDATEAQHRIADPSARKLVEWAILRSGNNGADYDSAYWPFAFVTYGSDCSGRPDVAFHDSSRGRRHTVATRFSKAHRRQATNDVKPANYGRLNDHVSRRTQPR
jgi:hypothetical protein